MTRLSNRQYPMLRIFAQQASGFFMSVSEAKKYDQRPFRSMLIRKWISYRHGKGFCVTRLGRDAWAEFCETEIWRKNDQLPLTAFFNEASFGRKAEVHAMPRRPHAA